jgi:hypothetical protein
MVMRNELRQKNKSTPKMPDLIMHKTMNCSGELSATTLWNCWSK